jgi:hypothetical protein
MIKKFYKSKDEFKPIAVGYGACIATDHITVDGKKVGYMYREEPSENIPADNGWRFFSGEESQEYVDNANNSCLYDTNTIVNYDQSITPFLSAPIGSAFCKNEKGEFIEEC